MLTLLYILLYMLTMLSMSAKASQAQLRTGLRIKRRDGDAYILSRLELWVVSASIRDLLRCFQDWIVSVM